MYLKIMSKYQNYSFSGLFSITVIYYKLLTSATSVNLNHPRGVPILGVVGGGGVGCLSTPTTYAVVGCTFDSITKHLMCRSLLNSDKLSLLWCLSVQHFVSSIRWMPLIPVDLSFLCPSG